MSDEYSRDSSCFKFQTHFVKIHSEKNACNFHTKTQLG